MPCDEVGKTPSQVGEASDILLDLPAGVPPLTSLYLYIAGSCNLACRHCWITPAYQLSGNDGKFVKLEYVSKAIHEAKPLGLRSVKLTGGEPTLHPQFREIVTLIDEAGLDIIVETNGTLVDSALADFLKQKRVCFISVSLDGATAEVHEALRLVPGSFNQAINGISALVEAGFHPQVICTLHRGNVFQMADMVALTESLGCGSVKFNLVQRVGRGEHFAGEQGLEIPEIIKLFVYVESELAPKNQIPIYFDVPIAFFSIRKLIDDPLSRCTILTILGMLADGELSLCGIGTTVPELVYGHIERDNLREVWVNSPGLLTLREQIPDQLEGICGQCLFRDTCLGACVANNFHTTGRLNSPYHFCEIADGLGLFPISKKSIFSIKGGQAGYCGRASPAHNTPHPIFLRSYKKKPI